VVEGIEIRSAGSLGGRFAGGLVLTDVVGEGLEADNTEGFRCQLPIDLIDASLPGEKNY
jgi:hypothetical protein